MINSEEFTNSLLIGDIESAKGAFWPMIFIQTIVVAFLNFLKNVVASLFTTKMSDSVRKKMLNTIMRGGTAFETVNRAGKLNDAFANQVK